MKKKELLCKRLLWGALSLALAACSNETILEAPGEQPSLAESQINISVKTPASEGVIVRSAQTRAVGDKIADEADEAAVNTLKVYLFTTGNETADPTDADLKFHSVYSFNANDMLSDGNEKKTCSIQIPEELRDQAKAKLAFIANDTYQEALAVGATTLKDFKSALATASVTDGSKADELVGGETAKSFPMTAMSEVVDLTSSGVDVEVELVRNVARLDIFNYTPNMIIKSVEIENVNDKSYLFGTADALNIPSEGLSKISLLPLLELTTNLGTDGIAYNPKNPGFYPEAVEDVCPTNSYRTAYLYEQAVPTVAESPVITIRYELEIGTDIVKDQELSLIFQNTETNKLVDVKRNWLYRIRLGDGTPAGINDMNVKATFEVEDWIEGDDINGGLKPGDGDGDDKEVTE